jgi:hypothetical protein
MAPVTDTPPRFELAHAASATAAADLTCASYSPPRHVFVNVVMGAADAAPEQAWFWTTAWQAGEWEAAADLEAGRTERFDSSEAFLEALRGLAQE